MKLLLAGVALTGLVATALLAQDAPREAHAPMMKPITKADAQAMVAQHFAALDLNHDGKVTKEEVETFRMSKMEERRKEHRDHEFARLDSNHDGSISKAEFDVPHVPGPGEGPMGRGGPGKGPMGERMGPMGDGRFLMMGMRWFDRADANHDGAVTLAEAQTAAAAMFDRIDTNHDGTISPDELRAMWGMHREGGWGHRSPGDHRGPGGDMPPPPPQQ